MGVYVSNGLFGWLIHGGWARAKEADNRGVNVLKTV